MIVKITDYGATVVSIIVPDRKGGFADVVFGYDDADGYAKGNSFFGATIGRFANRIAGGRFRLDANLYSLPVNDGANTLHGGPAGFSKRLWTAEPPGSAAGTTLKLTYFSQDGEEGFQGTLTAAAVFTLTGDNELRIRYAASTDRSTVVNMTYHNYFNLSGDPKNSILDEQLMIAAEYYTPVDSTQIPTGSVEPVGTPMDFRRPAVIGSRIGCDDAQLKICRGYDMNWVLNDRISKAGKAVELYDASSGRVLEVCTDQPGLQFYTGNFLDGPEKRKDGVAYEFRSALALETQHYPDSPNKPAFQSTTLMPGDIYDTFTSFKVSVRDRAS